MSKKARAAHGGTPATVALTRAGVDFDLHPYETQPHEPRAAAPSYGEEAAAALGLSTDRVFKTLLARVDERLVVAVVPVSGSLDLKSLAAAAGGKRAAMAEPADAERATGYVVGGISPIGTRTALPTVVDETVADGPVVYVSAGRRGLQVSLAPDDLLRVTGATVAPIRRGPRGREA
ncbi:MAG: Cys-tRNA(Pro) deacylase [Actinomycetes bacterium]